MPVRYNARGDYASVFYSSTHATGGVSGGINWLRQFSGNNLASSDCRRSHHCTNLWLDDGAGAGNGRQYADSDIMVSRTCFTAWSTPGAALLVTGLQGLTLNEAIGVFIVTNALIVLCGITGLFARLMRIIPHSLAAAMLAGILLRFGLQAFASLDGQFTLCGSMLLVWLATKAVAPRYAVIAAMIIGIVIVIAQGDVVTTDVVFKPVLPTYITPDFSFAHSLSVALPFFW